MVCNPKRNILMTTETDITAWLATQHDAMVALLREMVDIDSGSYNKPGIDAVGAVVQRFMQAHGIPVTIARQQNHGDCLRAAVPWDGPAGNAGGNIVLMGHRDTVFPDGEVSRRPFTIRDGIAYGPGVADMKAGPGDELLRARSLREVRRLAGAARRTVHRRRGDRQPGRAAR